MTKRCCLHPTAEVLRHYLAAACDPLDAAGRVARRGDELLRKRCAVDSPKPVVDLEDPALVRVRQTLRQQTLSIIRTLNPKP